MNRLHSDLGFTLGAAIDATRAEGAATSSDWATWEREGRLPRSRDGAGFATTFADDLPRLADLGIGAVRLTLDWSRLEPVNGAPDESAFDHYDQIIDAADAAGLTVWATLLERVMPGWFALDERGFRDDRSRGYLWPRHVERVAERFADRCHAFVPIADPVVTAATGYLGGSAPPGRRDGNQFRATLGGMRTAAEHAARLLSGGPALVASGHDVTVIAGVDAEPTTRAAAALVDDLYWGWASSDPGPWDLLGVTVGAPVLVDEEGNLAPRSMPDGDLASEIVDRLGVDGPDLPVVVIGHTPSDADGVAATLDVLGAAVAGGTPLDAWFHRPAIDGYELHEGHVAGRGLLARDRTPTERGAALAEWRAARS